MDHARNWISKSSPKLLPPPPSQKYFMTGIPDFKCWAFLDVSLRVQAVDNELKGVNIFTGGPTGAVNTPATTIIIQEFGLVG